MNRIALFSLLACCIASCSKNNQVTPVTGSIDGVQATSLYGGSNRLNDYILLGRAAGKLQISYYGTTYDYTHIDSDKIRIVISSTVVMRGTLDTEAAIIKMTVDTSTHGGLFSSTEYTSR